MTAAFFYNIAYKILESIYTNTYTDEILAEIIKEEEKKKVDNEILSKTIFFYNTLNNFPWYTILSLIEKMKKEMKKESKDKELNSRKEVLLGSIEGIDFELKERLKTMFYQNIEIVFRYYYSRNEKMSEEETTLYLSQNLSRIDYLVSLELAEDTEYEKEQNSFSKIKDKEDFEISDDISKENFNKKKNILNSTINILKNYLDDNGLEAFLDLIEKSLKNIAKSYSNSFPINMGFYYQLLQKIYRSVIRSWMNSLKKQNESPLLKMLQE